MKTSRRLLIGAGLVAGSGALAASLNPLSAFNFLVPKDDGSVLIDEALAYGPDPRHKLDVYGPAQRTGPLPLLVFFYGGAWSSGARQHYAFAARALAAQGFIVALPDYRLVPSVRYPAFLEDCAAAVRWSRQHLRALGADTDSVYLMGHSAGAYNAAMLAFDPTWLGSERAALRGLVGLAGPYDFLPLSDPATQAAFGHVEHLAATQPVHHAAAWPPALLLHGAADVRVRPRNSRSLHDKLVAAGNAARLALYPGVDHGDILLALSGMFRGRAPTLADAVRFMRTGAPQRGQLAGAHGAVRPHPVPARGRSV